MKRHILAVTAFLFGVGTARAQVKDLAELFPARTKAYLEINQVAQVVKEVQALLKGSCLEDMPRSLEKLGVPMREDPYGFRYGSRMMLGMGLFLGPEVLSEVSRFGGGAVAITDIPKDLDQPPEAVGVLRTGDSNLPGFYMRMMMTMMPLHKVAEVEGVGVYRERRYFEKFKDEAPPPKELERGPAMAMVPGAIVLGTSSDVVGDVIRRWKGKGGGPSLASVSGFQKAGDLRARPGLFAYSDGSTLAYLLLQTVRPRHAKKAFPEKFEKFEDKKLPLERKSEEAGKTELALQTRQVVQAEKEKVPGVMQELLDSARGFGTVALNLELKNGTLSLRGHIGLDTSGKSPWADFFTERTVDMKLLKHVPKNTHGAMFLAMPQGTAFWDKLGKVAPQFETEMSLALGKSVLKIAQVGLVDSGGRGAFWLVDASDADGARDLAGPLSKWLGPVEASGRLLVLSRDRKLVQEVLAPNGAGKGILEEPKVVKALKDHQKVHTLAIIPLGQTVRAALGGSGWGSTIKKPGKAFEDKKFEDKKFEDKKFEGKFEGKEAEKVLDPDEGPDGLQQKHARKLNERLNAALEPVPPLVISLKRQEDQLILTGAQTHLLPAVARIIDILVEAELTRYRMREYYLPPRKGFKFDK
jgi:hypothetical protein